MSCLKLAAPLTTLRIKQSPYLILKDGGGLQGVAGCFTVLNQGVEDSDDQDRTKEEYQDLEDHKICVKEMVIKTKCESG